MAVQLPTRGPPLFFGMRLWLPLLAAMGVLGMPSPQQPRLDARDSRVRSEATLAALVSAGGFGPLQAGVPLALRVEDKYGSGEWGAARSERIHKGVDVVVKPGLPIIAPCDAKVKNVVIPLIDHEEGWKGVNSGLELEATGALAGYTFKIWWFEPDESFTETMNKVVATGDVIGKAPDLSRVFVGITPHVHVAMLRGGVTEDPSDTLGIKPPPKTGETGSTPVTK